MTAELDPITQVHNGLVALLKAHPLLADTIRAGNWVDFSTRSPEKDEISTADVPELRLLPTGDVSNLSVSSGHAELYKTWSLQIATGDMRVAEYLFPLEWAALCALMRWREVLRPLEWEECAGFVKSLHVVDHSEGQTDRELLRGINGWTIVFNVRVHIMMPRTAMLAWAAEEAS